MSIKISRGIQARPKRLLIYGQAGVGKTTLISKLPGVLFADTEDGTSHLNVDRVPVRSLADLRAIVAALLKSELTEYKVLAIDTADRLWDLCAADICKANNWESIEQPSYGKGMKMATEKFLSIISALDRLVEAGISVILVCHCKIERMSPPDLPEYTMYQPKVSAPGKQAEESKDKLVQWADTLGFARFDTAIDAKTGKAVGEPRRMLELVHTAYWEAKHRGSLPAQLDLNDPAPLMAELGLAAPAQEVAAEQPEPEAVRGSAAVPPSGSHPAELGFNKTRDPEAFVWSDDEYALLIAYFTDKGLLQPGQTLADLPANFKAALKQRPKAALQKAREHEIAKSNAHRANAERGAA